jgi:hypothetical protein
MRDTPAFTSIRLPLVGRHANSQFSEFAGGGVSAQSTPTRTPSRKRSGAFDLPASGR